MRRASRDCSVETEAACCWSSQKPGRPISCSSSAIRCFRPSGSKVITDPVELDPDLLQLLSEWLLLSLGHMAIVAGAPGASRYERRKLRPRPARGRPLVHMG